ncbi:SDR family oxidoreductase [Erythrobacteraceae bacterium CFH 75059]|uniref:SDR family NAD(P)-dependent oxidoreductase n=1 Tax=Qipengyuania thermophila TaxID=2509361 RepID=UPI0010203660|nr:SDR family oxidoreductase [Qipengyuania thermophila]TCD05352.1 SDR family oxidoreductase [Erythrobacteraceae bacterium CFH 75059]
MQKILLTGASRGIGAATLSLLHDAGARVVGQSTAGNGDTCLAADFARPGAADALWHAALDRLGGQVDVVIANAGVFESNPLDRGGADWAAQWERQMTINLSSAAQLARLAIAHWLGQGAGGRLVFVASRAGHRGDSPDHWHYAAAKGGMLALHKTIARGYARHGILSFAVAPGFVDTAMAGDYLASRGGEGILQDIPLGRVAEPEEIARIIAFCALEAPASMTGATLDANGASYVR